jgi:Peptidase family S41
MALEPKKAATRPARKGRAAARKKRPASASSYLKKMDTSVRAYFADAVDLPTFLATAGTLDVEERKLIVRQALILIEQNYAHLPLKRAMHAIDPVQRLKLLLQQIEQTPDEHQPSEPDFHREMTDIFTSLRDLHTNYLLPAPFNAMTAFLPFMVEDFFEDGKRKYLVSHIAEGFSHPTFVPGVEVIYWNGMPIERAVLNNAQRYAGSNREARHARGVQNLTSRALIVAPPPDEEWVVAGYRTASGSLEEIRLDWVVNPPLPAGDDGGPGGSDAKLLTALGLDLEQEVIQGIRKALFAPHIVATEEELAGKAVAELGDLETIMPKVFAARPVPTPHGTFGYLRIRTFSPTQVSAFVKELIRLVSALPQNGLIIDVRGNGGGVIWNGEYILQVFTPRRIEPEPTQFINTPLNLEICRHHSATSPFTDLSPWLDSMRQALQTGSTFSAGFPISNPETCNSIGQRYFGPVVLITDALCYSTTDIFAAGFQDHEIGPVLGADDNTGAGGANVWKHNDLQSALPGEGSYYKPLPNGAGMRVSMRRTLRVGRRAGAPVEDLGVYRDERHFMTRNDLLNNNVDLINKAASMLENRPLRALTVELQPASPSQVTVKARSQGMTRLDFYLGDRPIHSVDVAGEETTVSIPKPAGSSPVLEIRGFAGPEPNPELVARYRTAL